MVARVDGDEGWALVDRLAMKYPGIPYPRGEDRVAFIIRVDAASSAAFGE